MKRIEFLIGSPAALQFAVGRKNRFFVGGENGGERASVILTVIAGVQRHDLDGSLHKKRTICKSPGFA
jgi:hypothetical protein